MASRRRVRVEARDCRVHRARQAIAIDSTSAGWTATWFVRQPVLKCVVDVGARLTLPRDAHGAGQRRNSGSATGGCRPGRPKLALRPTFISGELVAVAMGVELSAKRGVRSSESEEAPGAEHADPTRP